MRERKRRIERKRTGRKLNQESKKKEVEWNGKS